MFTKHISELQFSDIEDLINVRKEREGYHLDYKEDIGNPDRFKVELSKDVSSFGNSDGGFLVVGVSDSQEIVGIDPTIQNKPVEEWINQVLSSNIDPPLFYYDPKVIPIPGKDKVIVIIHVPESTKKPHMVSEKHQYFIRTNDSNKPTTHNQVREMFEYSRRLNDEFKEFLERRNLSKEDDPSFGMNIMSKSLFNGHSEGYKEMGLKTPVVLYSVIPHSPSEERFHLPFSDFRRWLIDHSHGYEPKKELSFFTPSSRYEMKMNGVVFTEFEEVELKSYFEILSSGFVELGCSNEFFVIKNFNGTLFPSLRLTQLIGYELVLLGFMRDFYKYIKYYDDVLFQISLINVLGYNLTNHQLDDSWGDRINKKNHHHMNIRVIQRLNPTRLSDQEIIQIGKYFSERICSGFGNELELCFDKNDKIKTQYLFDYR